MEDKYSQKANTLIKVIDIAIHVVEKNGFKDWNKSHIEQFINRYNEIKAMVINPDAKYKNIQSLKYLENDIFIFFQESSGKTIDDFWKEIKENKLHYIRDNKKIHKILKNKKIKNNIEYEFVKDVITPYTQENIINEQEAIDLGKLLEQYEKK